MLRQFRTAKAREIGRLRALAEQNALPRPWYGHRPSFAARLRGRGPGALIAEYKRASPSMGDINLGLSPREAAAMFAENGAAAMSVLTEEAHFKGDMAFLGVCAGHGLPLLRKDFLFDPLQVAATAATPASALLLIARMFPDADALARMLGRAQELELEAVVEIFDEQDLAWARMAGAVIIQVNARDLDTLAVDQGNVERLVRGRLDREVWIAASGIAGPEQVRAAAGRGYDAVLVGTAVMAASDPSGMVRSLAEAGGAA
ncbi:MAG: indole-3-glycerol-phosphate synthase [Desulfovibrio sp.]|jgi:indole-3-glycerol phosphate synthase|nr:indole-3-glycerol-phosphate synthase [Desulfovibrio sp.]